MGAPRGAGLVLRAALAALVVALALVAAFAAVYALALDAEPAARSRMATTGPVLGLLLNLLAVAVGCLAVAAERARVSLLWAAAAVGLAVLAAYLRA